MQIEMLEIFWIYHAINCFIVTGLYQNQSSNNDRLSEISKGQQQFLILMT